MGIHSTGGSYLKVVSPKNKMDCDVVVANPMRESL